MAEQLMMVLTAAEPVIPLWFDIAAPLVVIAYLATIIAAIITLIRAKDLPNGERIAWVLFLVFAPFIGAIAWLGFRALSRLRA